MHKTDLHIFYTHLKNSTHNASRSPGVMASMVVLVSAYCS